ncbi:hypothetical protein [Flavobacterium sp. N1994]|uniref:hypothetical protein n=1 Tax=Flavobacterium sp. N1994 TaxID=2986827 RepID=UPI002222221D|nr:hypothetical protein [Flavobacterium sp. N1994]
MKNRAANYQTKVSYYQFKEMVDRKKMNNSELVNEKAMIELKKIYWYEKQLLIAIPLLISSASTFELVETLTVLNKYTREHVKDLEANFPSICKADKINK